MPKLEPAPKVWAKDEDHATCGECDAAFSLFLRRHHCRECLMIYCDQCCPVRPLDPATSASSSNPVWVASASAGDAGDAPSTTARSCGACFEKQTKRGMKLMKQKAKKKAKAAKAAKTSDASSPTSAGRSSASGSGGAGGAGGAGGGDARKARADTKARSDTTTSQTSQMDDVDLDVSDHHQVRKGSQWQKDGEAKACCKCAAIFTVRVRRHHCRCCGQIFCDACTQAKVALPDLGHEMPVRVCDHCLYTVSRAMARQYVFNVVGL